MEAAGAAQEAAASLEIWTEEEYECLSAAWHQSPSMAASKARSRATRVTAPLGFRAGASVPRRRGSCGPGRPLFPASAGQLFGKPLPERLPKRRNPASTLGLGQPATPFENRSIAERCRRSSVHAPCPPPRDPQVLVEAHG